MTRAGETPAFSLSADRDRLDVDLIHRFLDTEAYWWNGIARARVEAAIAGSEIVGAYADGQIGFARAVTDRATFAWIADVFVVGAWRGRGVGRAMVRDLIERPALRPARQILLGTRDAHGVYAALGFAPLAEPWRFMRRPGLSHADCDNSSQDAGLTGAPRAT